MKKFLYFILCGTIILSACGKKESKKTASKFEIRGVHLCLHVDTLDVDYAKQLIPEIGSLGFNTLILEVDNAVRLNSHPELAKSNAITTQQLKELIALARNSGLEVIPDFQTMGHQDYLFAKVYPDLVENPEQPYAYCPSNSKTYTVLFEIYDELIELFKPKYFHIGHDEILDFQHNHKQIGFCEQCRKTSPDQLLARDITKIVEYLKSKDVQTMMWGDMLLAKEQFPPTPGRAYFGGEPENTWNAINLIPKEVVVCDWHYGSDKDPRPEYPSLGFFITKGFRTIGTTWYNLDNIRDFTIAAESQQSPRILGMIISTWCAINKNAFENTPHNMREGIRFASRTF